MKFAVCVFILSFFTTPAHAIDYQTTAIYCNGPVESGNVADCPSLGVWMGVSLKDLKSVSLPITPTDAWIRLQDASGNIWEQPLETCKSKFSDLRGCNAMVDLTKPGQISIHISIWGIRKPQRNLALFINDQNQLSLLLDEGDSLMFSLVKK